jgi:hypothetical protein
VDLSRRHVLIRKERLGVLTEAERGELAGIRSAVRMDMSKLEALLSRGEDLIKKREQDGELQLDCEDVG